MTMTGLEVLGLACNIMQALSFAHETIVFCKAVYQGRAPDEHLGQNAQSLAFLTHEVQKQNSALKPRTGHLGSLCAIADKCNIAARALEEEVAFLASQHAKGNLAATLRVAVKANWRKSRLERLEKAVSGYQNTLNSYLLAQVCKQSDALQIQQLQSFNELDARLQGFVEQVAAGNLRMDHLFKSGQELINKHTSSEASRAEAAIKKEIVVAERSIKHHIASGVVAVTNTISQAASHLQRQAEINQKGQQLLHSLKFADMNERRNCLSDSHKGTFSWIFDQCDEGELWDDFSDWLRSDSTIYWISGKPGSGKSTLVKFLIQSRETREALKAWSGHVMIAAHFFWKPGSMKQKNLSGMFSSLLHQLLSHSSMSLSAALAQSAWVASKDWNGDWSLQELHTLFFTVLRTYPSHVCFFLDGLDEICKEDGVRALMSLISDLRAVARVKVCVASRPEPALQRRLDMFQQLRLQDLTGKDMKTYVQDRLQSFFDRPEATPDSREKIVETLLCKAEGVFLWLHLALRSLEDGLENGDSLDELLLRLQDLPNELEQVYSDMWLRVNSHTKVYLQASAMYFQLLIDHPSLYKMGSYINSKYIPAVNGKRFSILQLAGSTDPMIQNAVLASETDLDHASLDEHCKRITNEVDVRCAGLLEIVPGAEKKALESLPVDAHWLKKHLRAFGFIHRTAFDFIMDTEQGCQIRSFDSSSRDYRYLQLIKGRMVEMKILGEIYVGERHHTHNRIEEVLKLLSSITDATFTEEVFGLLEICWQSFDEVIQQCHPNFGYYDVPTVHFLALFTLSRSSILQSFIMASLPKEAGSNELATTILRDYFATALHWDYMYQARGSSRQAQDAATGLFEYILSLGADVNLQGPCTRIGILPAIDNRKAAVSSVSPFGAFVRHVVCSIASEYVAVYRKLLPLLMEKRPHLEQRIPIAFESPWSQPSDLLPSMRYEFCGTSSTLDSGEKKYEMVSLILDVNLAFLLRLAIRQLFGPKPPGSVQVDFAVEPTAQLVMVGCARFDPGPEQSGPRVDFYRVSDQQLTRSVMTHLGFSNSAVAGSGEPDLAAERDLAARRTEKLDQLSREIKDSATSQRYESNTGKFIHFLAEIGCGFEFVDDVDAAMSRHYGRPMTTRDVKEAKDLTG